MSFRAVVVIFFVTQVAGIGNAENCNCNCGSRYVEPYARRANIPAVRNYQQFFWDNIYEKKDTGLVKKVTFKSKRFQSTGLKVTWNGDLRVRAPTGADKCSRWFFKINGQECQSPGPIDGVMGVHGQASLVLIHRVGTVTGICDGIPVGDVNIEFHVGPCNGLALGDAETGWNSGSRLIVEEV